MLHPFFTVGSRRSTGTLPRVEATPAAATLLALCERADEQQLPALLGDLAADGGEIIAAINEQPGAWVKPLLEELLQEVAHGRVENRRDALAAAAKQLHEKKR